MPVKLDEEAGGKLMVVTLGGKLVKDDYAKFTPAVESAVHANGKVRMVILLRDFHGWSMGALWEDIKFDVRHFTDIERVAMVGDKMWEAGMALFCKPFTSAKVRYFDEGHVDEALVWASEGLAHPAVATP